MSLGRLRLRTPELSLTRTAPTSTLRIEGKTLDASRNRPSSHGPSLSTEEQLMTARRLLFAGPLLALTVFMAPAARTADDKDNPAAKPLNRDNARHKQFLEVVAKG